MQTLDQAVHQKPYFQIESPYMVVPENFMQNVWINGAPVDQAITGDG
jgi:hypothetical protein